MTYKKVLQRLKQTHSDVPGAFAVGFVGTGEPLAGHDARVGDQVASAEEGGPERVSGESEACSTGHPAPPQT